MATHNPLKQLKSLGQSVWLDYIDRGLVRGGELARLIAEDGLSGVTSNPAIFHRALTSHGAYDEAIARLAREGLQAHEILETLVIEDIRDAADLLSATYTSTQGADGFVSLEVSPHFARDAEGTYWEAKRLWTLVNRENLMIKVPGTVEGLDAIRRLVAEGLNINITLLFSVERYAQVAEVYLGALERRVAAGLPVDRVASVASFFLSRIDTLIDERLASVTDPTITAWRGRCATQCAREAYLLFKSTLDTPRFGELAKRGARVQRLLWASTGTKNPAYSDVKYVEALVARNTVATMPPETLSAYRDHGRPALQLSAAANETSAMDEMIERLAAAGIDWSTLGPQLEEEGIRKFIEPHEATLAALRARLKQLRQ